MGIALLCAVASGCVRVYVSSTVPEGELQNVATANQKGDIPAAMKVLEVDNSLGDVRVTGVESGPLEWSWKLTVHARSQEEAERVARAANFRAESDGDKLMLETSLPSKVQARIKSDIEIRAPKSIVVKTKNRYGRTAVSGLSSDVEVSSQSGAVEVSNVSGKVRAQNSYATLKTAGIGAAILKNQSGSIEVSDVHGSLDAETSYAALIVNDVNGFARLRNQSGRIEAAGVSAGIDAKTSYATLKITNIKGDAVLANQSGSINVESVTGLLKAATSYASLEVAGVGGPNVVLQNQSGRVKLQGVSVTSTNLDLRTTYSPMEVHLPGEFKPALLARTTYAKVESDFPLLQSGDGENPFDGVASTTPRVLLRNQSGSIRVTRD